ncbi:MAG: type I-C CRISPR-associated protein Cas5 [Armatimonadetes bacterium]|nr:type I-C CRISPR-associated protein Cas5 [Armatimonadota bacterium]
MSAPPPLAVKVWGDLACFTRPELKVERVSYQVMTPSAARGILEAIFRKPEVAWRVERIKVLRPIRHLSILRNEVDQVLAPSTVSGWMKSGEVTPLLADEHRAQRHTLALRDVEYVIEARLALRPGAADGLAKYVAQFQRRVEKGQCHVRPCLGCREFPAHFAPPEGNEQPIDRTDDLGQMLFDLRYGGPNGRADPVFFAARLEDGVLEVPAELYQEVGYDLASPV